MAHEKWDLSFWQGKRVFLTGHTGFIGSWLSLWLTRLGANVAGFALAPHTVPSLYETLALEGMLTSTIGDICDRVALTAALDAHQPQIVIHLAAQAIVGWAHADAYETWRVNALGTVALLEALRGRDGLRALSIFTTDKVYDNFETGHAYCESDPLGGLGVYDSSKAAAELAVRALMHGNAVIEGTATIRAGNVIGGGDWSEARLVPDCARAFTVGQPVQLRHPASIRPWQHVLDVCAATLRLTQALHEVPAKFKGAWNIGPDASSAQSAAAIATQLAAHWQQVPPFVAVQDAPNFPEAQTLLLDATKFNQAFGWRPILPLAQALSWTAFWYQAWEQSPERGRALTQEQIIAFETQQAGSA